MPRLYPVEHVGEPINTSGLRYIELGAAPDGVRSPYVPAYVSGELRFGPGAMISDQLEIGMPDKPLVSFRVGDQARIYGGQIASRNFTAGDYLTIHEGVWAYGKNDITIGHNCWFGRRCTLDAEGGFWVGNGLGAGQDSHLWSHIRHGDTLAGNRWLKYGDFIAGDDVWFVGRCTSAPASHGDRSMAMVESNVTKGMPADTIWGGNPAKDLTEKLGAPSVVRSIRDIEEDFQLRLSGFAASREMGFEDFAVLDQSFDAVRRTYKKTRSGLEVAFMRYLLPEAKFIPEPL